MSRKPATVESFGGELMAALLKGATDGLDLHLPFRSAIKFRKRVYSLRSSMAFYKHSQLSLAQRVSITIHWEDELGITRHHSRTSSAPLDHPCVVSLRPNDSEFGEALRQAGITLDITPEPETPTPSVGEAHHRSDLLKGLLDDFDNT